MGIQTILLLFSLIILIGAFAEWVFKKTGISDTIILILIGFILGKSGLNIININSIKQIIPVFTVFTLYFIIFDGSLYINIKTIYKNFATSLKLSLLNYFLSSLLISIIFILIKIDLITSLMLGFTLGGISGSYVIPLIKQLNISKNLYTILTFESSITDVFSIVFAIAFMEVKILKTFSIQNTLGTLATLFSVAAAVGIISGFFWFYLEGRIIERDKNYLIMISYITLVYIITEYLHGNGAIAVLFLGITLTNSETLIRVLKKLFNKRSNDSERIVSKSEKSFYSEISFFLKTFFFVYIGLLIKINNISALILGLFISLSLMFTRNINDFLIKSLNDENKEILNYIFARGIAPAAVIKLFQEKSVLIDPMLIDTVYIVIVFTMLLTSIRIFFIKKKLKKEQDS